MDNLLNDLRSAARTLWQSKGLTLVAVVSLAIGIGANTAIFSIVNSLLLRPRPVAHPEQFVELYVGHKEQPYHSASYPSYLELRERNEVLSGLAAYSIGQFKLGDANQVEQIWGEAVSGNYFDVLGVQPHKGRMFLPEEDLVPGRNPTRLGFESDNVLVANVVLDETQYDRSKSQEFYRQLSDRVRALPGVQAVSLVEGMPGGFLSRSRRGIEIEGYQPNAGESREIDSSIVGPRYFTNMKVPFLQGRDFDERDREGATCVAIINEAFSQKFFSAAGSPLGRHLYRGVAPNKPKQVCEIVGIVRDNEWQSLQKVVRPFFALALMQSEEMRMTLLVNSEGDPASLTQSVRRTLQELDPKVPVNDIKTLRDYFSTEAYPFRLLGIVMGACGFMALLLATVGIYGVVSYSVAQRTREVGIRMALGAVQRDILTLVVRQGMVPVAYGLGAGLLLGFALTRVLTSEVFETELLFGVSATDTLTFAGVTLLLACVALVACCVPARRATQVDPLVALRNQ